MVNKIIDYLGMAVAGLLFLLILIGLAAHGFDFQSFVASWGLRLAYGMGILAAALVVIMGPVFTYIGNPQNMVRAGAAVVILAVLFLVAYGLAGSGIPAGMEEVNVSETSSQMIGSGLKMMYILLIGGFIALVYSMVSDMFRS